MEPTVVGLIAIAMLVAMLFLGLHVFVAMGLVGLVGFWFITGNLEGTGALAASTAYSVGATYEFSVIPLFILLGMVILRERNGDRHIRRDVPVGGPAARRVGRSHHFCSRFF
jgi:hypothetical protein